MGRFKSGASLDDILGRADGLVQVYADKTATLIEWKRVQQGPKPFRLSGHARHDPTYSRLGTDESETATMFGASNLTVGIYCQAATSSALTSRGDNLITSIPSNIGTTPHCYNPQGGP
jgi:hypothetical protein